MTGDICATHSPDTHPGSSMSPASDSPLPRPGPRRYGRWLAIVVASLLLHLAAFDLLPHWTVASTDETVGNEPLRARLLPPITPDVQTPAPAPLPEQKPIRKAAPRRSTPEFVPESLEPVPEVRAGLQSPGRAPSAPAVATPPAAVEAAAPAPVTPPAPAPAPPPVAAVAPQSARLSYKVIYTDQKNANPIQYNGVGTIDWTIADGHYRSTLLATVPILFIKVDVLAAHSEGSVTSSGVAPDRYTESPRKRPTVATNFNRDARQSITFSATQASVPLVPGVQDRLSLLFQIGALLLANGQQAIAGGHIDMPVAGVRGDVENWTFESRGGESIETGSGPLSTTHLRRTPRSGSNDRTIDVWIAQSDGGYPARVLYTEPNGSTVEMLLEKIGAVPE